MTSIIVSCSSRTRISIDTGNTTGRCILTHRHTDMCNDIILLDMFIDVQSHKLYIDKLTRSVSVQLLLLITACSIELLTDSYSLSYLRCHCPVIPTLTMPDSWNGSIACTSQSQCPSQSSRKPFIDNKTVKTEQL